MNVARFLSLWFLQSQGELMRFVILSLECSFCCPTLNPFESVFNINLNWKALIMSRSYYLNNSCVLPIGGTHCKGTEFLVADSVP